MRKQIRTREDELNEVQTWCQGAYIHPRGRRPIRDEEAEKHDRFEKFLVRSAPTGNALAQVTYPEDAVWIAKRLNRLSAAEKRAKHFAKYCEPALSVVLAEVMGWTPEELHKIRTEPDYVDPRPVYERDEKEASWVGPRPNGERW